MRLLLLALAALAFSTGCSLANDFGKYTFGDGADSGVDSGTTDSGTTDSGTTDAGTMDSGTVDAGADAGFDGGVDAGPRGPTAILQTSGGAVIQTSEYRLRISIGAPQPVGTVSDATHRLRVGPVTR